MRLIQSGGIVSAVAVLSMLAIVLALPNQELWTWIWATSMVLLAVIAVVGFLRGRHE